MDGFAIAAGAITVILSAIVRLIRTDAAWKAVDEGYAGVDHVRDLTGIFEPRALQDVFGPPTMEGGIYKVERAQILAARRWTGWLMGLTRARCAWSSRPAWGAARQHPWWPWDNIM